MTTRPGKVSEPSAPPEIVYMTEDQRNEATALCFDDDISSSQAPRMQLGLQLKCRPDNNRRTRSSTRLAASRAISSDSSPSSGDSETNSSKVDTYNHDDDVSGAFNEFGDISSLENADELSVFELQQACKETNKVGVGSIVCTSLKQTFGRKRKTKKVVQQWGTIVHEHTDELFDVESFNGKVLKRVKIVDISTVETSQRKDEILWSSGQMIGETVYGAWPGIDPKNESYFWGKIQEIKTRATPDGTKYLYTIIFFPEAGQGGFDAGSVDITKDLSSEFFHRGQEAKYLMENGVVETSDLPASARMTLQELIQLRQEQQAAVTPTNQEDFANDNVEQQDSSSAPPFENNGGLFCPYNSPNATAEVGESLFDELKHVLFHSDDHMPAAQLCGMTLTRNLRSAFSEIGKSGVLFDPNWVEKTICGRDLGHIPKTILLLCLDERRFAQASEAALNQILKDLDGVTMVGDFISEYKLDRRYIKLSSCTVYNYADDQKLCHLCELFVARTFRSLKILEPKNIEPTLWKKLHDCLTIMDERVQVPKNGIAKRLAELEAMDAAVTAAAALAEMQDDGEPSSNELEQEEQASAVALDTGAVAIDSETAPDSGSSRKRKLKHPSSDDLMRLYRGHAKLVRRHLERMDAIMDLWEERHQQSGVATSG